ncbi:MAG: DNA mismatch repair protein MutS, partial [Alcanivoracaceae bacterium]|nr:DNA mismatch repair protein MutS [Alcanivoracaceae bacterium]
HYFELTQLAEQLPGVHNAHLSASEHGDHIVFLHRVQDGPASRSYGLQVAQLAGVPAAVIRQARDKLAELEAGGDHAAPVTAAKPGAANSPTPAQAELFSAPSAVEQALAKVNPDDLSPREALELLYQLKRLH